MTIHPGDHPLQRVYKLSSADENRDFYDEWASKYDQDLAAENWAAPSLSANALLRNLDGNTEAAKKYLKSVRILDAGCGTGLAGVKLAQLGAQNIDGIDISSGMLRVARSTGAYASVTEADLTKPIAKPDHSYDAVLCVGTLTQGHVGPTPVIGEFVRILKPHGKIVATILDEIWESHGFKAEVDRLQSEGAINTVSQDMFTMLESTQSKGRLLVLEKQ